MKALFFDIDGTILSEETNTVPESAVRAIQAAEEAGHLTFINTGRTRACIPSSVRKVGFDGFLCGCGTEIVFHGKSIMHKSLDKDFCGELAQTVIDAEVAAILEGEEFYFNIPDHPSFQFLQGGGGLNKDGEMKLHFQWDPRQILFDKLVIWTGTDSKEQKVFDLVKDKMEVIVRSSVFYEIIPKGYTKAKAIQTVMDLFGIRLEDTYVFGDSSNDLSMFQFSPNAIALGKHDPILDPYTSYVTDTVEKDGIAKAMEALGLIEREEQKSDY